MFSKFGYTFYLYDMPKHDFIKEHPHFKLEINLKDMVIFESALRNAGIDFYRKDNPILISGNVTYFIADVNRKATDAVIKSNKLDAGTQTIMVTNYPGLKKCINCML